MIELNQAEIVSLMVDKLKHHGSSKYGTYNHQDPTYYEKGHCIIGIEHGFNTETDDITKAEYPLPENVEINWMDCTWGIEFKINTSIGLKEGYFDSFESTWHRCSKGFFTVIKRVFLGGREENHWAKGEPDYVCEI